MSQHFLLSAKARTLSLGAIMRMTDDQAHGIFKAIRWADNGGEPFCPKCECTAIYTFTTRRIWKCKACSHQFSVTSGTIFASRKLPIRDYLAAIAIFVNAVKGISALQLGRGAGASGEPGLERILAEVTPKKPKLFRLLYISDELAGHVLSGGQKPYNRAIPFQDFVQQGFGL